MELPNLAELVRYVGQIPYTAWQLGGDKNRSRLAVPKGDYTLVFSKGSSADSLYFVVEKDGETILSIGQPLDGEEDRHQYGALKEIYERVRRRIARDRVDNEMDGLAGTILKELNKPTFPTEPG